MRLINLIWNCDFTSFSNFKFKEKIFFLIFSWCQTIASHTGSSCSLYFHISVFFSSQFCYRLFNFFNVMVLWWASVLYCGLIKKKLFYRDRRPNVYWNFSISNWIKFLTKNLKCSVLHAPYKHLKQKLLHTHCFQVFPLRHLSLPEQSQLW